MKTSHCQCGERIYFENTRCNHCGRLLGFLTDAGVVTDLDVLDGNHWIAPRTNRGYRQCQNHAHPVNCNWMILSHEPHAYCLSCRLDELIPDLSKPENQIRWSRIERAKRRLFYSLYWLGLPVVDKTTDPQGGLSFRIMEDRADSTVFPPALSESEPVLTGHLHGTITLNLEEADPVAREEIRTRMNERYRTLLGHLRHESGHYYWDRIVQTSPLIDEFRAVFGDERMDYERAMRHYYEQGPRMDWQTNWISAYASSHPWEDWAECWAHYLHITDTLETAYDFGLDGFSTSDGVMGQRFDKSYLASISVAQLADDWTRLSVILNEMNRSMGLKDAYPFILSGATIHKLAFVHKVIVAA